MVTRNSRPPGLPLGHDDLVRQLSASCKRASDQTAGKMPRLLADTTQEQAHEQLQAWADQLDTDLALAPSAADAAKFKEYMRALQDRIDLFQTLFAQIATGQALDESSVGTKIEAINDRLLTATYALLLDVDQCPGG